ncbi:MAG: energy transducer TonB [Novosphingobium sp.]
MAYADAQQTTRKFGAGASVLAIEVGIAWAIIAALGMTITKHKSPPFVAVPIQPDVDPPKPVPTTQPTVQPRDPVQPRPVDRIIDLGPTAMPTFIPEPFTGGDDGGGIDIPIPRPTPPPVPTFTPKAARPLGNYAGWVTTNDYPTAGLRGEHEGSTRYRLTVDAAGKPTGCTVTGSSGFADLDSATCATLMRRAKFTPATDETGARVAGSYAGTVTWRLPEE